MKRNKHVVLLYFFIQLYLILFLVSCDKSNDNKSPLAPYNPTPANNETNVELNTTLQWLCSDCEGDKRIFELYMGTDSLSLNYISDTENTAYELSELLINTKYFWRIIAIDENGNKTEGPIWTFTTKESLIPEIKLYRPVNNSINIDTYTELFWELTGYSGTDMLYNLYFGNEINPSLFQENIAVLNYSLSNLDFKTTYYWKIKAHNTDEEIAESVIWEFTTKDSASNSESTSFELGNTGIFVKMIWIEPGSFMMGAKNNEIHAMGDEYPRHEVTISKGFWMGIYEVTQEQWEAVAGRHNFYFNNNSNRPAEMVSWKEIHDDFLDFINRYEDGDPWRLPSEAEWEYACRAGNETRFWWGDDIGYHEAVDYMWSWENNDTGNGHETKEVGQKLPNPWGLYDMNGNVWEWCEDQYHFNYEDAPVDGSVWGTSDENGKVARGGGWGEYGAKFCRSAARGRDNPNYGYKIFGFRLVRDQL